MPETYHEHFAQDAGGWVGWRAGGGGPVALEWAPGRVSTRSPWGVDFNHAPPGAGYLHLLFVLWLARHRDHMTRRLEALGGANRFLRGGFSSDLRHARLRLRLRGAVEHRGSQLLLLVQSDLGAPRPQVNLVLHAQPLALSPQWQDHTLHLTPDPAQWTCLGRGPAADLDRYGCGGVDESLANVNVDLILVLFPLQVVPAAPVPPADLHRLRAGVDYPLNPDALPEGWVELGGVELHYPRGDAVGVRGDRP